MKKIWIQPLAEVESFQANEYIAKCADTTTRHYHFECNAGMYDGVFKDGMLYQETNGIEGLQIGHGGDTKLHGYHACGKMHHAQTESVFVDGYYLRYLGFWEGFDDEDNARNVIIWDSTHATESLNVFDEVIVGMRS